MFHPRSYNETAFLELIQRLPGNARENLTATLFNSSHFLQALDKSGKSDVKHPSLVLLILLSCLMLVCFFTFCCWRHFFGDMTLIQLWGRQNDNSQDDKKDPPPTYAQARKARGSLTLVDHLYPPPSYKRARELSESEDHFLSGGLPELKDDNSCEIYDMYYLAEEDGASVMSTIHEDAISIDSSSVECTTSKVDSEAADSHKVAPSNSQTSNSQDNSIKAPDNIQTIKVESS